MPGSTSILAASLSLLATLTSAQNILTQYYSTIDNTTTSACPSANGAHLIVARASQEPLGYGTIGMVKDKILTANAACNAEYVVYPATLASYPTSESSGVLGMKALVEAFLAQDCPGDPPVVLMGYSQGAHVVSDYLSGQNVKNFGYNATLTDPASEAVLSRIAAVITMGDPSINITSNAAHVGNSTKSGLFERAANSSVVLAGISDKSQAYCDALDPYCASAPDFSTISVHLGYVQEYGMDATEFVLRRIEAYYAGSGGSSANGTRGGNETSGAGATSTESGNAAAYTGAASMMRVGSTVAAVMAMGIALVCGL